MTTAVAVVLLLIGLGSAAMAGDSPAGRAREPDWDGDGVADSADRCPRRAGLLPSGCPPVDTDGDHVLDGDDACREVAGPPENHGCPDKDSDADGIADRLDVCPVVMGTTRLAGCPEPDSDDDGVPDRLDKCATKKEVWNGRRDGDGCPDRGRALVVVGEGRIELARYPRLNRAKTALTRSDLQMVKLAGRALRSVGANAIYLDVVAEYGLSYGDSLQRAALRAALLRQALLATTRLAQTRVYVRWRGPDGRRRVELTYR